MAKKIFITDERMLKLIDFAVENKIVKNKAEYYRKIKFARESINKIRDGSQGFTKQQVYNALKLTGVSADWLYGFTEEIKRKPSKTVVERLREIVFELAK